MHGGDSGGVQLHGRGVGVLWQLHGLSAGAGGRTSSAARLWRREVSGTTTAATRRQ